MKYPLFFSYTDRIDAGDWSAVVVARGRCLLKHEDGEWWIEAIEPGGFTGHDSVYAIAMRDFRESWTEVLEDIAHEKASLKEFEAELARQFSQESSPAATDWLEARQQIRQGVVIDQPLGNLRRETADLHGSFAVFADEAAAEPESVVDEITVADVA